jgi:hypothetical protein
MITTVPHVMDTCVDKTPCRRVRVRLFICPSGEVLMICEELRQDVDREAQTSQ